jgi:hypothetical protein
MKLKDLPTDIKTLQKMILDYDKNIKEYQLTIKLKDGEIKSKDEEINRLKEQLFGRKTEKWSKEERRHALLFNEIEKFYGEPEDKIEENLITVAAHKKKRKKAGRKLIPDNFQRKVHVIDISDEEKANVPEGYVLEKMKEDEVSEELEIKPPEFLVHRYVRYKYILKNLKEKNIDSQIITAPVAPKLIPKAILHANSLAYLITQKFIDGLPLYRVVGILQRYGLQISRATLSANLIQVYELIKPILDEIKSDLIQSTAMQIDESRFRVMREKDRSNTVNSQIWVFRSGLLLDAPKTVYYHYEETRSAEFLKDFLIGYKGVIQTDGYSSYITHLKYIIKEENHANCNVHARRNFIKILKQNSKHELSNYVIDNYKIIYKLERIIKAAQISKEEIELLRQKCSLPIMEEMKDHLGKDSPSYPENSSTRIAINYFLNHYDRLTKFIYHGCIPPDTNLVENSIRPFVIGRKNWLFAGSPNGAKASAAFYTLVENCKLLGINPFEYLKFIFAEITKNPKYSAKDLTPSAYSKIAQ